MEVEISLLLTSPNLSTYFVQCRGYDESKRTLFLDKKVSDCFEVSQNSNFIGCLIRNVSKLHSLGIVHYDIKPENVLIDHNNNFVLADFGLSDYIDKKVSNRGTPLYKIPRIFFQGSKRLPSVWADYYSVALCIIQQIYPFIFEHLRQYHIKKINEPSFCIGLHECSTILTELDKELGSLVKFISLGLSYKFLHCSSLITLEETIESLSILSKCRRQRYPKLINLMEKDFVKEETFPRNLSEIEENVNKFWILLYEKYYETY